MAAFDSFMNSLLTFIVHRFVWRVPSLPLNSRFFGEKHGMPIVTVGVRGGVERGGGLGLTLLSIPSKGKPKAPAPLHTSPYPYSAPIFSPIDSQKPTIESPSLPERDNICDIALLIIYY